jgi:hypothetical protein
VELGGVESAIVELSGARFAARKSLHAAGRSLCARARWGKKGTGPCSPPPRAPLGIPTHAT